MKTVTRKIRFHQRLGAFGVTAALGLGGGGALLRSCGSAAPAPAPSISAPLPITAELITLANQQRRAAGLPGLSEHPSLATAAQGQSMDQARRALMTHAGSNGSNAGARIAFMGYRWSAWGENVAAGQTTPRDVMNAWMNSPGHRANILSSTFTDIGVAAVAGADGTIYWTMDLASGG
jgi:uncharacterized protein YkwD